MLYSNKLYIGITRSMSSALSICIFFILLMQSANEAQFLNVTFLLSLFSVASAAAGTVVHNKESNFDATMCAYNGVGVCELIAIFMLLLLSKQINKNQIGLYRDDDLAI